MRPVLAIAFVMVFVSGCSTTRGQAKAAGAQALGCPIDSVDIQSHPGAEYTVRGCGAQVDVDCKDPRTVDRSQNPEGHSVCRVGKAR